MSSIVFPNHRLCPSIPQSQPSRQVFRWSSLLSWAHCPALVVLKSQNTRWFNNPEVLAFVLARLRILFRAQIIVPVLIQSAILRHQMNNTMLETHERLLLWWVESGPGSQFRLCSQHMRAINPQSDHYILITTSANDYQLCQEEEREARDSKETFFEQSSVKWAALHEEMVCGAVGIFLVSLLHFIHTFIKSKSSTSELNWPSETESLIRKAIQSREKLAKMILSWAALCSAVLVWAALTLTNLKVAHEGWKNLNKTARNHSISSPGSRYWLWIMG